MGGENRGDAGRDDRGRGRDEKDREGYLGDVVCMDLGDGGGGGGGGGGVYQEKPPSRFLGDTMASLSASTSSTLRTLLSDDSRDSKIIPLSGHNPSEQPEFLPGTMIPYEMYRRYRVLLEKKRDLKKELKMFDENFSKDTGRVPKKTDKEVIFVIFFCYFNEFFCVFFCLCFVVVGVFVFLFIDPVQGRRGGTILLAELLLFFSLSLHLLMPYPLFLFFSSLYFATIITFIRR